MEGTKEQYRFYIFTRLKLGDKPKKIHDNLQAVYGISCNNGHFFTVVFYMTQCSNGFKHFDLRIRALIQVWIQHDLFQLGTSKTLHL